MTQVPSVTIDTYTPDTLIAGETQIVTERMTLLAGQLYPRGAIIGRITATGKATLATAAATDGSQTPYGVLADTYDATAGDLGLCSVYVKGEFNQNRVIYGAGHSLATVHDGLRSGGIFLKPVVSS